MCSRESQGPGERCGLVKVKCVLGESTALIYIID